MRRSSNPMQRRLKPRRALGNPFISSRPQRPHTLSNRKHIKHRPIKHRQLIKLRRIRAMARRLRLRIHKRSGRASNSRTGADSILDLICRISSRNLVAIVATPGNIRRNRTGRTKQAIRAKLNTATLAWVLRKPLAVNLNKATATKKPKSMTSSPRHVDDVL